MHKLDITDEEMVVVATRAKRRARIYEVILIILGALFWVTSKPVTGGILLFMAVVEELFAMAFCTVLDDANARIAAAEEDHDG